MWKTGRGMAAKSRCKRVLLLFAMLLCFSLLPGNAMAAGTDGTGSGADQATVGISAAEAAPEDSGQPDDDADHLTMAVRRTQPNRAAARAATATFAELQSVITNGRSLSGKITYSGGTVTLLCDVVYAGSGDADTILIYKGQKITLDLHGHDINGRNCNGNSIIQISTGGNLTLKNSTEEVGTITSGTGNTRSPGPIVVVNSTPEGGAIRNNGTFIMDGGKISGNTAGNGGGIYCSGSDGTVTINGGEISNNTATKGGGIYSYANTTLGDEGTVIMNGGTISGNTAGTGGGISNDAKWYSSGMLTITNAEIRDNEAMYYGGGVYNRGTFTLVDATISGNTAGSGGGVYNETMSDAYGSGMFVMNGGTIQGNTAQSEGGGVYNEGTFEMGSGTINSNTADSGGGAYNKGTFEMKNGAISGNAAVEYGGGVHNYDDYYYGISYICEFTMEDGTISGNTSGRFGGGVAVAQGCTFTMNGGSVSGNAAEELGQEIYGDYDSILKGSLIEIYTEEERLVHYHMNERRESMDPIDPYDPNVPDMSDIPDGMGIHYIEDGREGVYSPYEPENPDNPYMNPFYPYYPYSPEYPWLPDGFKIYVVPEGIVWDSVGLALFSVSVEFEHDPVMVRMEETYSQEPIVTASTTFPALEKALEKAWKRWGSGDTGVAAVDNTGKVTPKSPGTAEISYAIGDATASYTVNIPDGPAFAEKTVSADGSGYSESAVISEINQAYRYRLSCTAVADDFRNVLIYDLIEGDTASRFAGTVTGIDLTGCGDIPVEVYIQGGGLAPDRNLPEAFSELPGDWTLIDTDTFAGWASVDAVALYFGDYVFDGAAGTSVYADVLMRSVPDGKNPGTSTVYSGGVTVTFGPDCQMESVNWDYAELWYQQDGTYYKAGRWGGSDLKNLSVSLPTSDFYLYWHTDGSGSSYYGFDVAAVVPCDSGFVAGTPGTLPGYEAEETADVSELTSAFGSHTHGDYGNNVDKLWHYAFGDPSGIRTIRNGMKVICSVAGAPDFETKEAAGTRINVTYDSDAPVPDPGPSGADGFELPRTGGAGTAPAILTGCSLMLVSGLLLTARRRGRHVG